ncbi:MAG: hypothetical protein ABL966_04945, partial [Acidimicrobiales bacterium]
SDRTSPDPTDSVPAPSHASAGRSRLARWTLHLLVAVATTAPLAWNLGRLPLGREPVASVPLFNLWSLQWTADRLPHLMQGWWDAPIFWPNPGTYAYSELQPLTGAAFALLRPLAGNDGAYGLLLLGALALNGIAGAALARRLGADAVPAALAGVLAQTLPFLFTQLGVLQLLMIWPLLAATASLLAWAEDPRPRDAAKLGLAIAAAFGTCGYHAALFTLCASLAGVLLVDRRWRHQWRERVAGLAIALGLALALTAPFLLGQRQRLGDQRWSDDTIRSGSARWDELAPAGRHWPGTVLVVLAIIGLVLGRRRPAVRFLAGVAAVATFAALGTHLVVAGRRPWELVIDHVGAFARIRSPFRFTATAQVALTGLAAVALQRLWTNRRQIARWAAPLAVAVAVLFTATGPGRLVAPPEANASWAAWLSEHVDGGAPVVHLPYAPGPSVADFEPTAVAMVQALDHGHPLVNGYSGFFPPSHTFLRLDLAGFPDRRSVDALRRIGVTYAVADPSWYRGERAEGGAAMGIEVIVDDASGILLRLP